MWYFIIHILKCSVKLRSFHFVSPSEKYVSTSCRGSKKKGITNQIQTMRHSEAYCINEVNNYVAKTILYKPLRKIQSCQYDG